MVKNKKILFATTPAAGHFNPLKQLAQYLKACGNDVRWYTTSDFRDQINDMGIQHYPFVQALDVNFENLNTFFPDRAQITSTVERMNFDMINLFGNRSREYYLDMHAIYNSFKYDLIICDNTFSVTPIIKKTLKIPVVAIGVMPLPAVSKDLGPYGLGTTPSSHLFSRNKNNLMRFVFKNVLAKKSIQSFNEILKSYYIKPSNKPLLDILVKEADLFLQIGTESFEYKRSDLDSNIRFIGSFANSKNSPSNSNNWYDEKLMKYSKKILISQGTVEKNLDNLIIPALEAFKESEYLLIVTTGHNQTMALREKYPYDNIIIEDYIPNNEIMPLMDLYITNGGYGGVIQALNYKLPIVAAGVFEGKNEICTRIGYFKYGIDLKTETPTKENLRSAVIKILTDNQYITNVTRLAMEFNEIQSEVRSSTYISEMLE